MRGEYDGVGWLFNSVDYIDFSYDSLLPECYAAAQLTFGGFDYGMMKELPFDEYNEIIKMTKNQSDGIEKMMSNMKGGME